MQNTPSIGKEYTYITIRKAKSSAHHSLFLRGVNYVVFFFRHTEGKKRSKMIKIMNN